MAHRSKPAALLVAVPFVAYFVWVGNTTFLKGSSSLHRGFADEVWLSITGGYYESRLECFGADKPRRRILRAADFEEATAFLEQTYPDCVILKLRKRK